MVMFTMRRTSASILSALVLALFGVPAFGGAASWGSTIPAVEHFVEAARVCSLAYEIDSVESGALQLSKTPLDLRWYGETPDGVEVSVIVGSQTDVIYVAFRGTDGELADTFVDAQFRRVPLNLPGLDGKDMGTVHRGFQRALKGILPALDAALMSAIEANPGHQIYFVGHSLGGALAHMYGLYAARTFLKDSNVRVMTVGQPRVGDLTFCENVEATKNLAVYRLVYEDDVVGRIPLQQIIWKEYGHAGHLFLIRRGGIRAYYLQDGGPRDSGYAGVPQQDWVLSFLDRPEMPVEFLAQMIKAMLDHAPWNYNKALDRAVRDKSFPTAFQTRQLSDEKSIK